MNELENLVYKNGAWFDKRTRTQVFIKPPGANDKPSSEVITPPEAESGSEGLKLAVKPIVRRQRKPKT
jgi:hypothetical protein